MFIQEVFPRANYKLIHAPGIAVLPGGLIVVNCGGRPSFEFGDWGDNEVLIRRSTDGGKTFLPRQFISGQEGITTNNPVSIADQERGLLHFFFCRDYRKCYHIYSTDGGNSFSNPLEITSCFNELPRHWNLIATGPGHGIRLRSGRLLLSFWCALGTKTPNGRARAYSHDNSACGVLISDDGGDTWKCGGIVADNTTEWPDPSEAQLVELNNGRILMNIRTKSPRHRRLQCESMDGGTSWNKPYFVDALFDPICAAGFCRTEWHGQEILLFVNPDSKLTPDKEGKLMQPRVNLTLRASMDGGRSYPIRKVIDPGNCGYSDIAVDEYGTIFCVYAFYQGSTSANPGSGYLKLATLTLDELMES